MHLLGFVDAGFGLGELLYRDSDASICYEGDDDDDESIDDESIDDDGDYTSTGRECTPR